MKKSRHRVSHVERKRKIPGSTDVLILWNSRCVNVSAPQTYASLRFVTNKNYSCQKIVRSGAWNRLKGWGISGLILQKKKKCSGEMSVRIWLWFNRLNQNPSTKSFPIQFRGWANSDHNLAVRSVLGYRLNRRPIAHMERYGYDLKNRQVKSESWRVKILYVSKRKYQ